MRRIEDEFPNIVNVNSMDFNNICLKSLTDDKILDSSKFAEEATLALNYIVGHFSSYGDQPRLKKPEYIHRQDRSYLSLIFRGNSDIKYHAIFQRTGKKERVDVERYFLRRNPEGSILEIHRIRNGELTKTLDEVDPRNTNIYQEVTEILADIEDLKSEISRVEE